MKSIALLTALAIATPAVAFADPIQTYQRDRDYDRDRYRDQDRDRPDWFRHEHYDRFANSRWQTERGRWVRLVRANAKVGELLREAALELLPQDTESKLAASVRAHVRQGLAGDAVGSAVIARKLHMSERTLRRKLDAEGIGLREVVDEERKKLALEKVLDESLSMDAIASDLGFTTAQALHRAFRRWTGDTVQAFRAKRRATR